MSATDQEETIAALQAKLDAANSKVAQLSGGLVGGDKDGFAECMTPECDDYKTLRPIPITVEVVERRYPPGSQIHGIESSTQFVFARNESDMTCPECGGPRSVLEDAPRKIPRAT
jgi:rubredoxin